MTGKNKAKKFLHKVEDMIEEKPAPETAQNPADEPEKPTANLSAKRRAALVNYLAGLLTLAFGAVLISMLVQQRDNRNTVNILTNDKTNALAKAEQLQDANRDLQEQINALELRVKQREEEQDLLQVTLNEKDEQNQEAQETIARLQKEIEAAPSKKAYELLLTAQNALDREDSEGFLRAMTELLTMKNELGEAGQALCKELEANLPQE